MRITVATPVFTIAGVPLAQVRFARALATHGHAVTLMIGQVDPAFRFPDMGDVKVVDLRRRQVRGMFIDLVRHLRRDRPEVVFCAEDHLTCLVLLAAILTRSKAKISGSSRVTPFDTYSNALLGKRWWLKQLMRAVMPRADALTCVSEDMVKQYGQVFREPPHVCVYNIVDDAQSRARMAEPVDHPWADGERPLLIGAGRLAPWKGFSDLIAAMSLGPAAQGARLLILGDGPLRHDLQAQIEQLGLQDSVQLVGYVENPLPYFAHADVFVLSSLVEGMPNVLVEAMLCGCTPVATDCPTGPRELLDGGRIGHLVPPADPVALAGAILAALAAPASATMLQNAVLPFHETTVIARHFRILGLAQASHGRRA
jgi:glycosyltransferase involved in cell wall biosynthesis